jgi:hypothetical protein
MAEITRVYSEAFLIDEGALGESARKWFKPNVSIKDIEDFTSSIRLAGSPASQWCELVILFAKIENADGNVEEVPHMRWDSFDEFKQEYLIDKNVPGSRFIEDESTKENYKYLLDYADI